MSLNLKRECKAFTLNKKNMSVGHSTAHVMSIFKFQSWTLESNEEGLCTSDENITIFYLLNESDCFLLLIFKALVQIGKQILPLQY